MKLGRKPPAPTMRQRLRSAGESAKPVNKTFSYSSRRSDTGFNTGRQLQRDLKDSAAKGLRYSIQRFGMVILLLAVLVSLFNILKLSSQPKIQPLTTGGSEVLLRSKTDYEKYATKVLADSIWNHNKITVNTGELSQKMLAEFPELTNASVTIPLLAHKPIVYIEPSKPQLILLATNGAFVVSDSGKALLRGPDAASFNLSDLPVVTDQSGLQLELGRQALPAASVNFLKSVMSQLNAAHVSIGGISLPTNANELDVQVAGQPYQVKFNLHSNKAREQAGTYLAAIASLQKQGITPSKYIDVRVDGRAYYQ
jgi:hypothetical protein